VLHEQLAFLGHEASEAENGRVAYKRWSEQPFDIIITDCHMPLMSGADLARAIRQTERERGGEATVIIGLTADAQPEEIELCIQAGMNECLIKPLGLDELDARLLALGPDAEPGLVPFDHWQSEPMIAPPETNKLLDLGPLELLMSNDPETFRQILDELINNNRKDCQILNVLLQQRDTHKLNERAHHIKGSARVVKAGLLAECCQHLEAVCLDPKATFEQLEEAVGQIETAIGELEQALLAYQTS
jgi:two-component system sensor histidine kinase EvgS